MKWAIVSIVLGVLSLGCAWFTWSIHKRVKRNIAEQQRIAREPLSKPFTSKAIDFDYRFDKRKQ